MDIAPHALGSDLAEEADEGGLGLEEKTRHPGHGLADALQLDLGRPLQLHGPRRGQVLVPVHAAHEVPRLPPLRHEHVGLGALSRTLARRVGVCLVDVVVGGDVRVDLERHARGDLPRVLDLDPAPVLVDPFRGA